MESVGDDDAASGGGLSSFPRGKSEIEEISDDDFLSASSSFGQLTTFPIPATGPQNPNSYSLSPSSVSPSSSRSWSDLADRLWVCCVEEIPDFSYFSPSFWRRSFSGRQTPSPTPAIGLQNPSIDTHEVGRPTFYGDQKVLLKFDYKSQRSFLRRLFPSLPKSEAECRNKMLKTAAALKGTKQIRVDKNRNELTVLGDFDVVRLYTKLRGIRSLQWDILSVSDATQESVKNKGLFKGEENLKKEEEKNDNQQVDEEEVKGAERMI